MREKELVPYEVTVLRGERMLVVAPHPDDETIGCGGLLAQHIAEGRECKVIVVTDGSAHAAGGSAAARREDEVRRALTILGSAEVEFLRVPDRHAEENAAEIGSMLAEQIQAFRPDLLLLPSPVETHPDHVAVARAAVHELQNNDRMRNATAVMTVAFYEVSQPIRPNTLVDVTSVAEKKWSAIRAHESQQQMRDYERYAQGINQYRTMTLDPSVKFAEAFWIISANDLQTMPWGELCSRVSPLAVAVSRESARVSVVVRTRNRRELLRDAVASIRSNSHPAEVVVVNDGGESPRELFAGDDRVRVVDLEKNVGRSEAMNVGVRAANGELICFLDDDDRYESDHIETLATRTIAEPDVVFYTDAVSTVWRRGESGAYEEVERHRHFGFDFDPDLLALDNFIPLPTVAVRKSDYLDSGGFDPAFDLFEDWDFLIRLSRKRRFAHVPRITCEIRHFEGGDSLLLSAWGDSAKMLGAKKAIWQKHGDLVTDEVIFRVLEKQKQRIRRIDGEMFEANGRASHLERDVHRLLREKEMLIDEIGVQAKRGDDYLAEANRLYEEEQRLNGVIGQYLEAMSERDATIANLHAQHAEVHASMTSAITERDEMIANLFREIERLNGVLDTIYRSRSWKLHQLMERLSGK